MAVLLRVREIGAQSLDRRFEIGEELTGLAGRSGQRGAQDGALSFETCRPGRRRQLVHDEREHLADDLQLAPTRRRASFAFSKVGQTLGMVCSTEHFASKRDR